MDDFIDPLARKLDQPPGARLALIAAFLAGVGILRNVLRIPLLQEAEGGEVERLIAMAIREMMREEPASAGKGARTPAGPGPE